MITKTIGKYTINYVPELALATVTMGGLWIVPVVVFEADGVDAFAQCERWVAAQSAA